MPSSRFTLLAVASVALGCRASSAPAPELARSTAFVLRLGTDTLAVDQFTVTGSRVEGTLVTHLPRTVITRYTVALDPATGMATQIEHNSRLPDGSMIAPPNQPGIRQTSITFAGDSAVTRVMRDTATVIRAAAPRAFPYLNYSMAFFQLPLRVFRDANVDSASYAIYTGGRLTTPMSVARAGDNTFRIRIGGLPYLVTTDDRGDIMTVDGANTTQHFIARRQGTIDVITLAAQWSAAERAMANRPPTLSPRDTTRATIGEAQILVDYSRPSARGRRVWGPSGVLNDTLWRTGANTATHFRTSVPLTIGGKDVPAGTYTLWTLAVPGRYQLIINKQTGQWGTVYDARQDLVRIPVQSRSLSPAVDRFTIAIDPAANGGGIIRLQWDNTELFVPFTVR
ncbi:MAG TPA: DUF2911 domain-containing protein [Gemmatimonadaceae bacterium]|nr:DUF2911 domain-containing protein [Gemmatimonadaceae bacterium]